MRLYLDDDSADPRLIRLLRGDGHDVQTPADVGLAGSSPTRFISPTPSATGVRFSPATIGISKPCTTLLPLPRMVITAAFSWSGSTAIRGTTCPRETSLVPFAIWRTRLSPSPIRISS